MTFVLDYYITGDVADRKGGQISSQAETKEATHSEAARALLSQSEGYNEKTMPISAAIRRRGGASARFSLKIEAEEMPAGTKRKEAPEVRPQA